MRLPGFTADRDASPTIWSYLPALSKQGGGASQRQALGNGVVMAYKCTEDGKACACSGAPDCLSCAQDSNACDSKSCYCTKEACACVGARAPQHPFTAGGGWRQIA